MFDSPTAEEYMSFATPVTAMCVKDGIPMVPFFKGRDIDLFSCGHCGLSITKSNKRLRDMPRNREETIENYD